MRRMTEEQYAALVRDRATRDERKPAGTDVATDTEKPASGPKFKSKAEAAYAQMLEARKRTGEIADWRYEAITLKLAEGVRYTPDFLLADHDGEMTLVEVKGGYIRDDARIKLRVAAGQFPGFAWYLAVCSKGAWVVERL